MVRRLLKVAAFLGLPASALILLAGIASFLWGGVLASVDPEPTPYGVGDGGPAALVMCLGGIALATLSRWLWRESHSILWPHRDAADDAGIVVVVAWCVVLFVGGGAIVAAIAVAVL